MFELVEVVGQMKEQFVGVSGVGSEVVGFLLF